jgi:acyl-CoA reductase-like NAD-dependent aldehyde dehydrogenase
MPTRLEVAKTYKLLINGQFPRSESGRSRVVKDSAGGLLAHVSHASRKDLRDAVEAARAAQGKWAAMSAHNRGQVLYRMAEMMEGKREELGAALRAVSTARAGTKAKAGAKPTGRGEAEIAAAIDRLVCFAGWADKYAQVLGCNNPVSGPYYNFTIPEPTGVVAVVAPDEPALLALISLLAPPLCAGNSIVAVTSETNPIPGLILGEVCATSDVPAGAVNILSGTRGELVPWIASHRDIDAVHAAGVSEEHARTLREGVAENLKRVTVRNRAAPAASMRARNGASPHTKTERAAAPDWQSPECDSPYWIEPFIEMKTVWHPVGA